MVFIFTYTMFKCINSTIEWQKRGPLSKDSERFIINAVEEQELQLVCDGQSDSSEVLSAEDKESWSVDDSQPSQSSIDSNSTTSSYNRGEKNLLFVFFLVLDIN